jgi:hypothetical protein
VNPTAETLILFEGQGLVHSSRHPSLPLTLWCSLGGNRHEWDEVTIATANGLVLDDEGRIVGRGLPKVFDVDDPQFVWPERTRSWVSFDKIDGVPVCVTTFNGELVVWSRYAWDGTVIEDSKKFLTGWAPSEGTTALFEALLDEHTEVTALVLLGEISNDMGVDSAHPIDVAARTGWHGEVPPQRSVQHQQLVRMCADPENGEGREGFVIVWPENDAPSIRGSVVFASFKSGRQR